MAMRVVEAEKLTQARVIEAKLRAAKSDKHLVRRRLLSDVQGNSETFSPHLMAFNEVKCAN